MDMLRWLHATPTHIAYGYCVDHDDVKVLALIFPSCTFYNAPYSCLELHTCRVEVIDAILYKQSFFWVGPARRRRLKFQRLSTSSPSALSKVGLGLDTKI